MYEYSDDEDDDDDDIYPFEDSQGTDNQLPIIPSPINLEDSGKSAELQQNLSLLSASAHSKLTPQRGFQSYTSSQRDPLNLARLYNTASPIIVCLLFLSCEITVKYLCKCFHATLERDYEMTADGLSESYHQLFLSTLS